MTAGLLTPTISIHAKQLSGLSRLALSSDAVGCFVLVLVVACWPCLSYALLYVCSMPCWCRIARSYTRWLCGAPLDGSGTCGRMWSKPATERAIAFPSKWISVTTLLLPCAVCPCALPGAVPRVPPAVASSCHHPSDWADRRWTVILATGTSVSRGWNSTCYNSAPMRPVRSEGHLEMWFLQTQGRGCSNLLTYAASEVQPLEIRMCL